MATFKYKVINTKAAIRKTIETSLDVMALHPIPDLAPGELCCIRYGDKERVARRKTLAKEAARILGMEKLPPRTTIKRIV